VSFKEIFRKAGDGFQQSSDIRLVSCALEAGCPRWAQRPLLFQHNEGKKRLKPAADRRKTTLPTSN